MVKKKKNTVSVRTQLAIATGAVCLLVVFGVFVAWLDRSSTKDTMTRSYADVTIRGTSVCLPRVDNGSTVQTLECAQGIKTESGVYYALSGVVNRKDDNTIEVTGTLTPPSSNNDFISNGVLTVK